MGEPISGVNKAEDTSSHPRGKMNNFTSITMFHVHALSQRQDDSNIKEAFEILFNWIDRFILQFN